MITIFICHQHIHLIRHHFDDKMFMDISDASERVNTQRQFFALPYTNGPNQTDFAKWLYGDYKICKSDHDFCLKYDDLRFSRGKNKNP